VWLKKHVSDHSAVSYLHQVLILLLEKTFELPVLELGIFQRDLLHQVGAENMRLVTSSAGHESLWYQRRLFSTVLLSWISKKHPNLCHFNSNLELCPHFSALKATVEKLSQALTHSSLEEDEDSQDEQTEEYNVDRHINSQKRFFEELHPGSAATLPHVSHEHLEQLIPWIQQWLYLEIRFVLSLLSDEMSWNPKLQRKYGLRYLYFLIFVVSQMDDTPSLFLQFTSHISLHLVPF
jgi:hypothetical protein